MNLEQLCISFAQAKKLKELGVDEESYYCYYLVIWRSHSTNEIMQKYTLKISSDYFIQDNDWISCEKYPAYTSAEIGEIISEKFPSIAIKCKKMKKPSDYMDAWYIWGDGHKLLEKFIHWSATEAQARADFLIYLLENKETK